MAERAESLGMCMQWHGTKGIRPAGCGVSSLALARERERPGGVLQLSGSAM
jgi:hypothetical protein